MCTGVKRDEKTNWGENPSRNTSEEHPSRKQTGLYVMNGPSKNINIKCNAKILPC